MKTKHTAAMAVVIEALSWPAKGPGETIWDAWVKRAREAVAKPSEGCRLHSLLDQLVATEQSDGLSLDCWEEFRQSAKDLASVVGFATYHPAAVASATQALKASGRVAVVFEAEAWRLCRMPEPGFACYHLRRDGSLGASLGTASDTEDDAWLMAAVRLAEYKPGAIVLTSREFGSSWTANVLCPDGSLGMLEERNRLEIRKVMGRYEVFFLTKSYLKGREPKDFRQHPLYVFAPTLGEAADYVGRYIGDFEGAATDDREAALEAHREEQLASV